MQGQSLIQLFDAKTGLETDRFEDHNLITNGVAGFLNDWARIRCSAYGSKFGSGKSLVDNGYLSRLYKGIVLSSELLTEDANQYDLDSMPIFDVVGYAGGTYAAANPLRGTYNSTESILSSNSQRLVFDFSTSQANGTIKSIALCPDYCGAAGFGVDNVTYTGSTFLSTMYGDYISNYGSGGSEIGSESQCAAMNGSIIIGDGLSSNTDNSIVYVNSYSGTVTLYKFVIADLASPINPFTIPNEATNRVTVGTYVIDGTYYGKLFEQDGKLYSYEYPRSGTSTPARLRELSQTDFSALSTVTLNVFKSSSGAAILGDNLYAFDTSVTPRVLHVFNKNTGAFINDITCPTVITPSQICQYSRNKIAIYDLINTPVNYCNCRGYFFDGIKFSKCMSIAYSGYSGSSSYYIATNIISSRRINRSVYWNTNYSTDYCQTAMDGRFLSTINNLETPVVKDSSKTMKITYQLTW